MKWKNELPLFGTFLIFLMISPIIGRNIDVIESTTSNSEYYSDEENARKFVKEINDAMFNCYHDLRELSFYPKDAFAKAGNNTKLDILFSASGEARNFIKTFQTDDDQLKRQVQLATAFQIQNSATIDEFTRWGKLEMDRLITKKRGQICSYNDQLNCNLNNSYVNSVVKESLDPNELLHYWKELHNANGPANKEIFETLRPILIKDGFLFKEFKSPVDYFIVLQESADILTNLDHAIEEMKPFYTNLHTYVRGKLRQLFGEDTVSSTGPIPHHLIKKLLVSDLSIEQPFDGLFPAPEDELNKNYRDASKLVRLSDEFFQSMGFDPLPSTFWSKYCQEKRKDIEISDICKSNVFHHTNEIGLKYCPDTTYGNYLQLHDDMAKLYCANEETDRQYFSSRTYKLENALGKAVILSASTPKHIEKVGIINYSISMPSRIYAQSITTMFQLYMNYAQYKLILEILDGQIQDDNVNNRYWELMEKYAGIKPPIPRDLKDFDLTEDLIKELTHGDVFIEIIAEIFGHQLYKELCTISGEYVDGNVEMPLENCDFSGSIEAGNTLKRLISLDETKPWTEVLKELSKDEPVLNAGPLLKYYKSLNDFIQKENEKNGYAIGWNEVINGILYI